jgi:peptidyl-Asp metalloendopeptidase
MKSIRLVLSSVLAALAAAPAAAVVYSTGVTGFAATHSGLAYASGADPWRMVSQADFDGNGYGDYVSRSTATGDVAITPYNASGAGQRQVFYTEPNQAWKIIGTGDFNLDGKADLLWRNSTTGVVWGMLMNGA